MPSEIGLDLGDVEEEEVVGCGPEEGVGVGEGEVTSCSFFFSLRADPGILT